MAYTPTEWETGDTVTAGKLNKLEGGVAAAYPLVATVTDNTLDKTWNEMHAAMETGRIVMVLITDNTVHEQEIGLNMICRMYEDSGNYNAVMTDGNMLITLFTDDPDTPPHFPLG